MDMREQLRFWRGEFGDEYARRNANFDAATEDRAWRTMLRALPAEEFPRSILEAGCNTGRNLQTISRLWPTAALGLIEPHAGSHQEAVTRVRPIFEFNGAIADCPLPPRAPIFDLVFTAGVLIHVHPDDLRASVDGLIQLSSTWILIAEYFNRTPVAIPYHGEEEKLFKRDFGALVLDEHPVECIDYGFLWGREYDRGGFDDITWWLFRKIGDPT